MIPEQARSHSFEKLNIPRMLQATRFRKSDCSDVSGNTWKGERNAIETVFRSDLTAAERKRVWVDKKSGLTDGGTSATAGGSTSDGAAARKTINQEIGGHEKVSLCYLYRRVHIF